MRLLRLAFAAIVLISLAIFAPVGMAATLFVTIPIMYVIYAWLIWFYFTVYRHIPTPEQVKARRSTSSPGRK